MGLIKRLKIAWAEGKSLGVQGYCPPFKEMRKKAEKEWKDEKNKDK